MRVIAGLTAPALLGFALLLVACTPDSRQSERDSALLNEARSIEAELRAADARLVATARAEIEQAEEELNRQLASTGAYPPADEDRDLQEDPRNGGR